MNSFISKFKKQVFIKQVYLNCIYYLKKNVVTKLKQANEEWAEKRARPSTSRVVLVMLESVSTLAVVSIKHTVKLRWSFYGKISVNAIAV